jgi:superfamily II DNA or RNA helicase
MLTNLKPKLFARLSPTLAKLGKGFISESKHKPFTHNDLVKLSLATNKVASNHFKFPREHQLKALDAIFRNYDQQASENKEKRGKVVLPCGAGKSMVGLWAHESIKLKNQAASKDTRTIVLMPSLSLVKQLKDSWQQDSSNKDPYLCVCSNGKVDQDKQNVTSDPNRIKEFLNSNASSVIYTTYQSLGKIQEALAGSDIKFDLAVFDEAHETAGSANKQRALGLYNENLPADARLFVTATPKVLNTEMKAEAKDSNNLTKVCDMDDESLYGPTVYSMNYAEAIATGICTDYEVIAVFIDPKNDPEYEQILAATKGNQEDMKHAFYALALNKVRAQYPDMQHTIAFCETKNKAEDLSKIYSKLYPEHHARFVSGDQDADQREHILNEACTPDKTSIVTNAGCLIQGVDNSRIDSVIYTNPWKSMLNLIQSTGRALRKDPSRPDKKARIIVPIIQSLNGDAPEGHKMQPMLDLINVMSQLDTRLHGEILNIANKVADETSSAQVNNSINPDLAEPVATKPADINERIKFIGKLSGSISAQDLKMKTLFSSVSLSPLANIKTLKDLQVYFQDGTVSGAPLGTGFGRKKPKLTDFNNNCYEKLGFGTYKLTEKIKELAPIYKNADLTNDDILKIMYGENIFKSAEELKTFNSLKKELKLRFGKQQPDTASFISECKEKLGLETEGFIKVYQRLAPDSIKHISDLENILKTLYHQPPADIDKNIKTYEQLKEYIKTGVIDGKAYGIGYARKPSVTKFINSCNVLLGLSRAKIELLYAQLEPSVNKKTLALSNLLDDIYSRGKTLNQAEPLNTIKPDEDILVDDNTSLDDIYTAYNNYIDRAAAAATNPHDASEVNRSDTNINKVDGFNDFSDFAEAYEDNITNHAKNARAIENQSDSANDSKLSSPLPDKNHSDPKEKSDNTSNNFQQPNDTASGNLPSKQADKSLNSPFYKIEDDESWLKYLSDSYNINSPIEQPVTPLVNNPPMQTKNFESIGSLAELKSFVKRGRIGGQECSGVKGFGSIKPSTTDFINKSQNLLGIDTAQLRKKFSEVNPVSGSVTLGRVLRVIYS